jgi:hypothetical protein
VVVEDRRFSPRALVALGAVAVCFAVSIVWATTGWRERDVANGNVVRARSALAATKRDASSLSVRVAQERATCPHINAAEALSGAQMIVQLDKQELTMMTAALSAGLSADVSTYNANAAARNRMDASHDATLESLRNTVNAVTAQLATL